MEEDKRDFEQYASDIATIKSILMASDEKFFYDPWYFYTVGPCILAGAFAQYFLTASGVLMSSIFYNMWIPLIILIFLVETFAWIKKVNKEGLPYFARYAIKLWSASSGAFVGVCLLIVILVKHTGALYVPVAVLVIMSMFMFFIAQVSYLFFYFTGVLFSAAAFAMYFIEMDLNLKFLISEALIGFAMIAMGVSTSLKEKGNGN
ncbi:MAG TPA: hypothetical protein PK926_00335 [Spirochaetota bacterium]|nr:hypothetical protein [Spirochaetota bacterium]HPI90377.1 hypothetical protein [Spirochaetota bacterium]HPR47525.1 hypothetical protein [Spirochaetota bacterium]